MRDPGTGRRCSKRCFPRPRSLGHSRSHADGWHKLSARLLLPRCYFDRRKCADGIEALRQYRAEFDEKQRPSRTSLGMIGRATPPMTPQRRYSGNYCRRRRWMSFGRRRIGREDGLGHDEIMPLFAEVLHCQPLPDTDRLPLIAFTRAKAHGALEGGRHHERPIRDP